MDQLAKTTTELAIGVAGLTDYLKLLLEEDAHLHKVWVVGEVSSANHHRQGCFFTLQEPDGSAAISCVVWKSQLPRLTTAPKVGEQVTVLGQIRLYPKRGTYQLTVWQVLPAGEGLQALRYRRLRARLAAEGLFDEDRKRPLPAYPRMLAVVTSIQAAAWGDIQRTLVQRSPGLRVLLSPAVVQGPQAPASIAKAIARVDRDGRADVLMLARGGGAVEDLACFDDERVVMAIAASPIPVVTGIGHQRDESLADLVADACAHTPTAAAEMITPSLDELYQEQVNYLQRAGQVVARRLQHAQAQVQSLRTRLQRQRVDRQLTQHQKSLVWQKQQLISAINQRLQHQQHQHQLLQEILVTLDPQAVLKRGYAIVKTAGEIATDANQLPPGTELEIQLGKGKVKATVSANR
ncbi:exodeoxyribonuclease VII, large subunit [Synechococcus sp. PCC 7335]|uniref:exodeoxyribonuclease VII large subunit n=1 Tax=Synechococcus sp. (strain ATCC 29403 / PCC 7335) TaxID=91464 RepID=UPI00017EE3C3|nr:exodeoxyribonuclease VII large subunit [Synechococcus sp. PCC 7335]EDX86103.1 exodeoxyribonuclease VII, large subunit [Synechococcus sp. PCC 7335]